MHVRNLIFGGLFIILCLESCQGGGERLESDSQGQEIARPAILQIPFTTTGMHPHDTTAFTEGFLVHDGQLYESTGHVDEVPESRSWFGPVDSKTGKIAPKVEQDKYFGEGICFRSVYRSCCWTYRLQLAGGCCAEQICRFTGVEWDRL